jgi:inorganic pyrophosphatase
MVAGAALGEKIQHFGQDLLGINDDAQMAANAEVNPGSTFVGGMVPALATMNPAAAARPLARVAGAGMMGGLEAVQEGFNEGKFDPGKIALATLAGGVFATPNAVGNRFIAAGEKAVPGRPNMAPNPAADQSKVDVGSQHVETTAAGGSTAQEPPLQRDGSSTGNPQSAPERSSRVYPKDNATAQPENDMLTQGDMDPGTRAALAGESEGIAPEASPLGEPVPAQPGGTAAPNTADVASKLRANPETTPEPVPPVQAPEQAAPKTETAPEPVQGAANPPFDPDAYLAQGPKVVDAGFPEAGAPVAVGENEATPMPKRAAAIEVSKANAAKPRLTLGQKPKPAEEAPSTEGVARKLVGETNHNPTEAQKEAGNYEKAGERLLGHDVKYENMKGSVRTGVDAEGKPWESTVPADYGYFKKTIGADKDHVDVYNIGTGDKHFIVDQREPGGKFDEHKVVVNARDINEARDTYLAGFSDDKALARLHGITEVDEPTLKQWLKTASKKKPFNGVKIEAPKAEPKVVTTAVTKLREAGHNEVADAIEKMPAGEERIAATNRALRMMTNKTGTLKTGELKNARIRGPAPVIEGAFDSEGKPITTGSVKEAKQKSASLKAARDLFDEHTPKENETTAETIERARQATLKAATLDKYPFKMQVKQEPALWLAEAKKISKKPSDAKVQEFIANEKLLRSGDKENIDLVRKGNRIESDIGLSRRSGDEAITNAENKTARFDIPHEEAEEMVVPKEVKGPEDLVPKGTRTLDMENASHRKELASVLNKDLEPTPKWKEIRDAKQKQIAETAAKQLADRQAKAAVGDAAPVRPSEVKSLSAEQKAEYVRQLEAASKKKLGLDALPPERESSKGGIKDLTGRFLDDESGAVKPGVILADLKKLAGSVAGKFSRASTPPPTPPPAGGGGHNFAPPKPPRRFARDYTREPKAYHSQKIDTPEKEYNNSLSDELHKIDTQNASHENGLRQWSKEAFKKMDPAMRSKLYFAHEEGKLGTLSAEERALYDTHVKPLLDENEGLKTLISAIDPDKMGRDVLNHIYRVVKGVVGQDPLKPGTLRDPLGAKNNISQRAKGTMLERSFVALERADGKRFVIQPNDKGFLLWQGGKALQIKDPTFEFKPGDTMDVGGNKYTMNDALTREIERNARNKDGNMMRYHHDAVWSAALANQQLAEIARHMSYIDEIKRDPRFQARATTNGKMAADKAWEHPKLPEFEKYWVDPMLKAIMDDYAKPGFDMGRSADAARQLSQSITKTIFWNPVIHPLNVAGHWFVGRGWDNLNVKSLLKTSGPAFKDVLTQGPITREIQEAGGSVMYGQTLTKNFTQAIGKALGHEIQSMPAVWDPIAKKFGMGPSTFLKAVYDGSQKIMWAANDMMYTQHYLEFRAKGMSPEGAVRAVEKDIPNYRLTPTLGFGQNHLGRVTSQLMADPLLTSFGRYHSGIWNAYANTVHGMIDKDATATERFDAVGKLFALGALMFVAKPLMDNLYKKITGNEHASAIPRGPLTIPADLAKAGRGEDDVASALRATTTLSPMVSMALQILRNKDFGDRSIIEPGDVRNAVHGSPVAAAKVAAQGTEFVARNAVAPLNVVENEGKKPNGGFLPGLRDQLLGIKNPSPKASKFEAESPKKSEQNAVSRQKAGGRGLLEGAVDKLGFK